MTSRIFYFLIVCFTTIFLFDYFFNQNETNQNNSEYSSINDDVIHDNSNHDTNNIFDTFFDFYIFSELME